MSYTLYDEFAGWGGSSQGASAVPGVELMLAANHNALAIDVHAMNFPKADHYLGDIAKADIGKFPRADIFWASPSCPPWSDARGVKRDFDQSTQGVLFNEGVGAVATDPNVARARSLMEEIPRYLKAMRLRGKPVLAGVVENVVQCRKWDEFGRWRKEIESHGYATRLIALNSMHVNATKTGRVPQSRARFYMAYWLLSFGRTPNWDKWLRPKAYCETCDQIVDSLQVFKDSRIDMGVYGRHGQYYYRCPNSSCRHQIVDPDVLPASTAIDWTLPPGKKIGERATPLKPATIARIEVGLKRYGRPLLNPAGGTWRDEASSVDEPMPTRTTRDNDALVVPPLLVPLSKRAAITSKSVDEPMKTQTARLETGLAIPPYLVSLRGGGSKNKVYGVDEPMATVSAQGNHHGLVGPPQNDSALLMSYYSNGSAKPTTEPIGTLTTKDRYALVGTQLPVEECTFRMLDPREVGRGMGFAPTYQVKGSNRDMVRGFGNAVTPPCAEVIVSALVEAISGEEIAA